MMNPNIQNAPAKEMRHGPACGILTGDCMLDESEPATRTEIVVKMMRRLNRLLGHYSKEHEEKLAIDIINLIENGIKKGPHNDLMTRAFVNKLANNGDFLKEVYLSAKNVTLEFGLLMNEGVIESGAEDVHDNEKVEEERNRAKNIVWVLRMALRRLERLIGLEQYDHLITEGVQETAVQFIKVMSSDIDEFCKVHGIQEDQYSIVAPPNTASPE
jgi:hypothetical protein